MEFDLAMLGTQTGLAAVTWGLVQIIKAVANKPTDPALSGPRTVALAEGVAVALSALTLLWTASITSQVVATHLLTGVFAGASAVGLDVMTNVVRGKDV